MENKIKLKKDERIDDLEFKNLKIIQNNNGFCFGIDSILLSDFAKNLKKNANVLDLGTGTGIIATLLCGKTNLKKVIGVEVQEEVYDMAKRSIILNNLENINAEMIANNVPQSERLVSLNRIARRQMQLLQDNSGLKELETLYQPQNNKDGYL